jgi:hypothetical protein
MNLSQMHVILNAEIDYPYEWRRGGRHLSKEINSSNEKYGWDLVEKTVCRVIKKELPENIEKIFSISIETEIVGIRRGSFIILFGIIFSSYSIISNYANFFESVELIKKQCKLLFNDALKYEFKNGVSTNEFEKDFEITISIESPILIGPREELNRNWFDQLRRYVPITLPSSQIPGRRDEYFYYLIAISIVILVLLGILVYKTLRMTYFY